MGLFDTINGIIGAGTIFDKKDKIPAPKDYGKTHTFDYETEEGRVATVEWLFYQAKSKRSAREQDWARLNDYYHDRHDVAKELALSLEAMDMPFAPATIPDPFIMVESQITPEVPEPEFHGRDAKGDDDKAKRRQKAVKFVTDNNRLSDKNTANERRLRKYGDAFWKVYWDASMVTGEYQGDIHVEDIPIENIYADPTAKRLEDCEYIDYVYTVHKNKFLRDWYAEMKKKKLVIDDLLEENYRADDDFLDERPNNTQYRDDMVQVIEHWFRQPYDGKDHKAGDIACSIQAGGKEIKYIPKYWEKTGEQNKSYPFVHYWCLHDETSFYNLSKIEPIMNLVDGADRELATGLLNDGMMANDIIMMEEGALVDGEEITNVPGSVVKVKQGKLNAVARLGGISTGLKSIETVNWFLGQIQRTNRNYDTNNGQETARVTTASGLLQLRSDAQVQSELKKADRNKGFCRLYELIDWACLEFYTEDRMLFIGIDETLPEDEKETAIPTMMYNSADYAVNIPAQTDMVSGAVITPERVYYPRVDVTVTTGEGLAKNPASTVQVLDRIAAVNVTADNYKLLEAELEYLDIPQKQMICEMWDEKFTSRIPPEVISALQNDPNLLEAVQQMATQPMQGGTPQIGVNDMTTQGELPLM